MLVIYRVPDSVQLEQFVATEGKGHNIKEIRLGKISLEKHIRLGKMLPDMENISHFEDSHIHSIETKQLYKACDLTLSMGTVSDEDFSILSDFCLILETAVQFNEGIITICD